MIILLGLPKSGTMSFQKLFEDLGYNSYHHYDDDKGYIGSLIKYNKLLKKPLLTGFKSTDVITQMDVCIDRRNAFWPQITLFKQIYFENQDSIFILNKRDPQKILNSFKKWIHYNDSFHKRLLKYNRELLNNDSDEAFFNFVTKHYTEVETFFSQYPDSKFIIFDIEKDNIEKLKKYIEIKDFKKLPHENKSVSDEEDKSITSAENINN
jgi:hypothetical protein